MVGGDVGEMEKVLERRSYGRLGVVVRGGL